MLDFTKFEGHTAGPWFRDDFYIYARCQAKGEKPIAEMLDGRIEDTEANISLIVAAPTLLSMLRRSVIPNQRQQVMESQNFDPMDALAANNGWLPLTPNESMSVRIGKKRYTITRDF